MKRDLKYLRLLAKSFPTEQSACTEIINLEAILNLPKGTEHFICDLHGEYEAFEHVLRNGSGVIRQKVEMIFGATLTETEIRELCTLIYYPEDKIRAVRTTLRTRAKMQEWYRVMLMRIIQVMAICSTKYTRSKVRKALPKEYSYIIEELLHEWIEDNQNKRRYMMSIVDTIIATGRADHFIATICNVIHRLVIDSLHIIGDIYDRGPGAHLIMETLCNYHNYDIQWGNHDIVWMGAAAGSRACVANVLRLCFRYANLSTLEDGYGINLLPLTTFAMETYADDPCTLFRPKKNEYEQLPESQLALIAKLHKAIAVIQFKQEKLVIDRNPEFGMDDRNVLHLIDFKKGTIRLGGKDYPLRDTNFPTIDPDDPYKLTPAEQEILEGVTRSFETSEKLRRHIACFLNHGSLYLVRNSNLLFHGSVPMNPDGSFREMMIQGKPYAGKKLFDKIDQMVRNAYYTREETPRRQAGQDFIWYLWCGPVAPTFDKDRMATFERYFVADKEPQKETNGAYKELKNRADICEKILREFGVTDMRHAHIINGHIPVKTIKGESPIRADGKLLMIDGGYSKAYQPETGIAGYTLIYNSQSLKLVQHAPFSTREMAVKYGLDILSETKVLEFEESRRYVRDTDQGAELKEQIDDLYQLLDAYRNGSIRSK
ncbi:MAG: fructose-1,6-bisphosphatase [Bacteroidales bacterium]|nr:fructose-1,6-bisphosphatase [Bacteroidales bacterium]MBQ1830847.1 fructose-1,6-bisphosphatase [Bacteroidales bacterium]MBQ5518439.1 fructose-1,6-bisphosphatase [Bacteroidales bacterium]MBQ5529809.1 fructose-1,6-bisphosphatase [Bacteroidales bacterium]